MNDRDCESCKKFSRNDPHESEGYCQAKRSWVDPQEGEDCKMHEFTLHSATKYKDGTPIMSEPEKIYCETDSALIHGETDTYATRKAVKDSVYGKTVKDMSNQLDYLERVFKGFAKTQDDLIEEYDETLKTHNDYIEKCFDRICSLEHIYEDSLDGLREMRERLCKITDLLVEQDKYVHIFSDFCGNCIHAEMKDGICACELSGEIVDPDDSSCVMFESSYTSNPEWFENMKKTMITPAEPTAGCIDCNCAKDGMCTKYNCSLGAICATPECHEPIPF